MYSTPPPSDASPTKTERQERPVEPLKENDVKALTSLFSDVDGDELDAEITTILDTLKPFSA